MASSQPTRRSTRLQVEIPVNVTSLDRMHPFAATCVALVVTPHGCGFRTAQPLPLETPLLLADLPGGESISARVANCHPQGADGKYFLTGVAFYNPGNVWGIADPPPDWNHASNPDPYPIVPASTFKTRRVLPYNLFPVQGEAHSGRK